MSTEIQLPCPRWQEAKAGNRDGDCLDLDDECIDVHDPHTCYQYDPGKGQCPLLRNRKNTKARQNERLS